MITDPNEIRRQRLELEEEILRSKIAFDKRLKDPNISMSLREREGLWDNWLMEHQLPLHQWGVLRQMEQRYRRTGQRAA